MPDRPSRISGVKPRAKIVALALAGTDPVIMLEGPVEASKKVRAVTL